MAERFLDDALWQRIDDLREFVGKDSHHYQTIDDLVAEVDRLEGEILRQREFYGPVERLLLALHSGATFLPTALSERLDFVVGMINPALYDTSSETGMHHWELEDRIQKLREENSLLKKIIKKLGPPRFRTSLVGKGHWRVYGNYFHVTDAEHELLCKISDDNPDDFDEGI